MPSRSRLVGIDIRWAVLGLMRAAEHPDQPGVGVGRHLWGFDLMGVLIVMRFATPYRIRISGPGWSLRTRGDPEGCPILEVRGDADRAEHDLTMLRFALPG